MQINIVAVISSGTDGFRENVGKSFFITVRKVAKEAYRSYCVSLGHTFLNLQVSGLLYNY